MIPRDLTDLRALCLSPGNECPCMACRLVEDLAFFLQQRQDDGFARPEHYTPLSVMKRDTSPESRAVWPTMTTVMLAEGLVRLAAAVMVRGQALGRITPDVSIELSLAHVTASAMSKVMGETAEQRDFLCTDVDPDEARH